MYEELFFIPPKYTNAKNYERYGLSIMRVFEGSFAEAGQLIAGVKFGSFLTPDMASKNDARHGIGFS